MIQVIADSRNHAGQDEDSFGSGDDDMDIDNEPEFSKRGRGAARRGSTRGRGTRGTRAATGTGRGSRGRGGRRGGGSQQNSLVTDCKLKLSSQF